MTILADVLTIIHFGFALFVVGGFIIIWIGWFMNRKFVHSPWFRLVHVLAMAVVVMETVFGVTCPLTVWEWKLRMAAGGTQERAQTFISHWAEKLFYFHMGQTGWLLLYVGFFLFILITFLIIPIDFRVKQPKNGKTEDNE